MPWIPRLELIAIIHHHFHRHPALQRKQIRHRHIHKVAFTAEITADVAWVDHKLFRVDAEGDCHLIAQSKRHFAAGPNLGAAGLCRLNDAGVRLDIGLVHDLSLKSIFNDQIGSAKAIFHITFFPG